MSPCTVWWRNLFSWLVWFPRVPRVALVWTGNAFTAKNMLNLFTAILTSVICDFLIQPILFELWLMDANWFIWYSATLVSLTHHVNETDGNAVAFSKLHHVLDSLCKRFRCAVIICKVISRPHPRWLRSICTPGTRCLSTKTKNCGSATHGWNWPHPWWQREGRCIRRARSDSLAAAPSSHSCNEQLSNIQERQKGKTIDRCI